MDAAPCSHTSEDRRPPAVADQSNQPVAAVQDFACTFAAYFMDKMGLTYLDGGTGTPAPDKLAFIDVFVNSIT